MSARRPNRPLPSRLATPGQSGSAVPGRARKGGLGPVKPGAGEAAPAQPIRSAARKLVPNSRSGERTFASSTKAAKTRAAGQLVAAAPARSRNRPNAAPQTRTKTDLNSATGSTRGRTSGARPQAGRWDSPRTLIVAFVLVLAVFGMVQPVHAWWVQQREYRAIMQQIDSTRTRNEQLQAELERWSSKEYVASQARARLQMVMPGETQYTVVDPGEHAVQISSAQAVEAHGPLRPWYLAIADSVDAADDPKSMKVIAPSVSPEKSVEENE